MKIENYDFASLIETWVLLETESAKLASQRRTQQDIENIREALEAYAHKAKLNQQAIEEDLIFHLEIVEASKNAVLKSLLLIIRPYIISSLPQLNIYKEKPATIINEHAIIFEHILAQEPEKAAAAMRIHLKELLDYSQRLKKRKGNGSKDTD